MARLELRLLGGFQARLGAGPPLAPPAKAQALLAYLALRPGAGHPRDKVAALLWGATSDAQARANLRHTVFTLRKALDGAGLTTDGHTLAIEPDAVDVDASTFEQLVADGMPDALERAGELYRGDLLDGLVLAEPAFEEWLLAERERLRELAVEALTKLLAHQMREPATERAIQTAMRLLALEPLQEAVHRTLMRLYGRQGRRAAALKQYQTCVSVLQRELGAEPETETKHVYQEVLQQRSSPTGRCLQVGPRGRRRRCAARLRSGLALADELGMRPLIADLHLGLGELYANIDKRVEARAELTAAADLYRATELTYRLPRVEAALARIAE